MAADVKPMSFHIPLELKERLTLIAKAENRSLTQQMIVMLRQRADEMEKSNG